MDLGIKGRVALITGGNRGIGKAAALEMAKEGCHIAITGRNEVDLKATAEEIKSYGVRTLIIAADLERAEEVEKMVAAVFESFGHIDILFNNAGHSHVCTALDATDEQWMSQMNIHLMSCVRSCRMIVPKMVERKWGRIINMSSIYGIAPGMGSVDYSAAKAAVINYTFSLAMEYSKYGICAVALCPGLIHTEIWEKAVDTVSSQTGQKRQDIFDNAAKQASSVKRFAKPEEVGSVVAFLASERASYITGCTIQVDGGAFAGIAYDK
jgi:3-oxoacyl-[acyl-carrier protein] reductase